MAGRAMLPVKPVESRLPDNPFQFSGWLHPENTHLRGQLGGIGAQMLGGSSAGAQWTLANLAEGGLDE